MGAVSGHQAAGFVEETEARTPTMGALGPAAPPAGSGCPEEVAAGDAAGPTPDAGGGGGPIASAGSLSPSRSLALFWKGCDLAGK